MKLLRVKVIKAETCGGLLDGFEIRLRPADTPYDSFDPLCLVGPNGSGKSQLMQVVAEIFQTICHAVRPDEERREANRSLEFQVEYLIRPDRDSPPIHVRATRETTGRKRPTLVLERWTADDWKECDLRNKEAVALLPTKVVGYTSGDNETLSLPFLMTRAGYAREVRDNALDATKRSNEISDTRLMLIDYGTNLEILVATQLLSDAEQRHAILAESNVEGLHSCRCIVQLAHPAVHKPRKDIRDATGRKGVQLTKELETYLGNLKRCATCHAIDEKTETYTFDYYIDGEVRSAFRAFWKTALDLYSAFHKFAMLNDLIIKARVRRRLEHDIKARRFASRLPEPQDEDKVFRFEQVRFKSARDGSAVDYVSLSDGEHQRTQILGTMAMQAYPGVLFLMDEPESHFNPQWRVQFISQLLRLPTDQGRRESSGQNSRVDEQECILTTHAPFVPSDMQADKVFIFRKKDNKVEYSHPDVETYGTTFDSIVESCFNVRPPISQHSLNELETLLRSNNATEIEEALVRLGHSVEKAFLVERLKQLKAKQEK
jgi:restriction system-associated AAA family ATPase